MLLLWIMSGSWDVTVCMEVVIFFSEKFNQNIKVQNGKTYLSWLEIVSFVVGRYSCLQLGGICGLPNSVWIQAPGET
jgi:hypothetical protein